MISIKKYGKFINYNKSMANTLLMASKILKKIEVIEVITP
jgi:hypothetical protein